MHGTALSVGGGDFAGELDGGGGGKRQQEQQGCRAVGHRQSPRRKSLYYPHPRSPQNPPPSVPSILTFDYLSLLLNNHNYFFLLELIYPHFFGLE